MTNPDFGHQTSPAFRKADGPSVDSTVWSSLASNLRDTFFTKKQPPLELISQPIAVADPLAVKRSPTSSALSFLLHAAVFALIVWFVMNARQHVVAIPLVETVPLTVKLTDPITMPAPKTMGGGGGGGARQLVEASKGHLPPVVKTQIAPPALLKVDHPRLAAAPAVVLPQKIRIPTNSNMPNLGMTQSPQI
ncbi:MAG: hypothetical protein ABI164_11535, partial [Acidobacteriaceae bacterium]